MIVSRDPEFQDLNFALGRPASRTLRSIGASARRSSPTNLEVFSKTVGVSTASHDLKQGRHGQGCFFRRHEISPHGSGLLIRWSRALRRFRNA
jgi:hypothetical protein